MISPYAAVVLVLVLLAALLLLLKRRDAGAFRLSRLSSAPPRRLEVLERVALGPQHTLHLVRVSGREVLVGTSPASCRLLEEIGSVRQP